MSNYDSLGAIVKRELVRSMLERVQSMNMQSMQKAFGATEPVVYEDVEETHNIAYVNREEVALAMDIFKPKVAGGTELPVIVVIHGGGLFMGERGQNRPYCRLLAHKGYLVFSLEYRLAPKANLCQQLDDVCAGMDHAGQLLVHYDVDFRRIFLIADSAGAYLAAYVSAMHGSGKLQNAIGYKPSRMVYAAVGFVSGMFYTSKELQEQIYGDKRNDPNFLKYMHIEHPEIIQNIPPAFLLTSRGDVFNNYSIRFNKVLKKGGRTSKLLYIGDEELQHIFPIMKPEHPKSIEATDRMLAWFEEQARQKHESWTVNPEALEELERVQKRIEDGSICKQKVWANIRERISADDRLMKRTALIDCTRGYSYEQMFKEWTRYAQVFSALGICSENRSRAALCGVIAAEPLFALFGLNMTGAEVSLFPSEAFLPNGRWKAMIGQEGITDLIISDIIVTSEIREEIARMKAKSGLRNVLYIHSLMGGPSIGPAELVYNEIHYHMLEQRRDVVFLNDLLRKYENVPVLRDPSSGERTAFILHAPGTASSAFDCLTCTDQEINEAPDRLTESYRSLAGDTDSKKPLRVLLLSECTSLRTFGGQVINALMSGDTLVLTYYGYVHPKVIRAIDYYNIDVVEASGFMVDQWLEYDEVDGLDFSSLDVVSLTDAYIPPEKLAKYREYFTSHGCMYDIATKSGSCGEDGQAPDKYQSGYFPESIPKVNKKSKHFQMPKLPDSVMKSIMKYGNRLAGIGVGRKDIDHDFEA